MIHAEPLSRVRQKRAPRLAITQRAWTLVQRELYVRGIGNREIADATGVSTSTVNRALSVRFAHRTAFGDVMRVRLAAERMLRGRGLHLTAQELWAPYDGVLHTESMSATVANLGGGGSL